MTAELSAPDSAFVGCRILERLVASEHPVRADRSHQKPLKGNSSRLGERRSSTLRRYILTMSMKEKKSSLEVKIRFWVHVPRIIALSLGIFQSLSEPLTFKLFSALVGCFSDWTRYLAAYAIWWRQILIVGCRTDTAVYETVVKTPR